jgi:NTP pyrophosphatase (non-canonical NTP hydrolase)
MTELATEAAALASLGTKIAELSEWIDSSYPREMIGTELHTRRRVDKLMEEAGEVGQAVGGLYGENPRKGITHTHIDVLNELLDVAVTALGAYESMTGNSGVSLQALYHKMDFLLQRVGLREKP